MSTLLTVLGCVFLFGCAVVSGGLAFLLFVMVASSHETTPSADRWAGYGGVVFLILCACGFLSWAWRVATGG